MRTPGVSLSSWGGTALARRSSRRRLPRRSVQGATGRGIREGEKGAHEGYAFGVGVTWRDVSISSLFYDIIARMGDAYAATAYMPKSHPYKSARLHSIRQVHDKYMTCVMLCCMCVGMRTCTCMRMAAARTCVSAGTADGGGRRGRRGGGRREPPDHCRRRREKKPKARLPRSATPALGPRRRRHSPRLRMRARRTGEAPPPHPPRRGRGCTLPGVGSELKGCGERGGGVSTTNPLLGQRSVTFRQPIPQTPCNLTL